MSEFIIKQKQAIHIERKKLEGHPSQETKNDSDDQWQPLIETIFYVKEQGNFEMELYFVNSNLMPRLLDPPTNPPSHALLGIRLLLQTGSNETELGVETVNMTANSPLKTFQISRSSIQERGIYVLAAQVSLKGSYVDMYSDMLFEAQNVYLAIARV